MRSGLAPEVTGDPAAVRAADGVVLPGVGAFADACRSLRDKGLDEAVRDAIEAGRPYLGLCLGLQLLFEESDEHGTSPGLGLLPGAVERFPAPGEPGAPLRVPHIGWNRCASAATTRCRAPAGRGLLLLRALLSCGAGRPGHGGRRGGLRGALRRRGGRGQRLRGAVPPGEEPDLRQAPAGRVRRLDRRVSARARLLTAAACAAALACSGPVEPRVHEIVPGAWQRVAVAPFDASPSFGRGIEASRQPAAEATPPEAIPRGPLPEAVPGRPAPDLATPQREGDDPSDPEAGAEAAARVTRLRERGVLGRGLRRDPGQRARARVRGGRRAAAPGRFRRARRARGRASSGPRRC